MFNKLNSNFSSKKLTNTFFYVGLLILLIPIWQNKYFLTGDGPCHLYNAKVLGDLFLGNHTEFYSQYYSINSELEPNWLTHFLYAVLQYVFPPYLAEKLLLTTYVLTFAFGLRRLLRTINPKAEWLVLLGMPLVYQKVLLYGFFNCAFSYVIFFYILDYWLRHKDQLTWKRTTVLGLLLTLVYFTHPMGLALSFAAIGLYSVADLPGDLKKENGRRSVLKKAGLGLVAAAPALLLIVTYFARADQDTISAITSSKALYHQLIEANFLVSLSSVEVGFAMAFSVICGLLFFYAIFIKIKSKKLQSADVLFLLFVLAVLSYFQAPEATAGGAFFGERMQFVVFLLLILWTATIELPKWAKTIGATAAFVIGALLVIVRIPVHHNLAEAAQEYASVAKYIEDESTVLPLSYSHSGKNLDGSFISDNIWMFMHAGDYVGAQKSVVMLGNYEANTGYFPLNYLEERNPYKYLGDVEAQPPVPHILEYPERSKGGSVDYVILWCYDESMRSHETVNRTLTDLESHYEMIFETENKRAILYKLLE